LSSIEKFKGKRENFIFNTFIYFEPVKRFKNRSGMTKFRSLTLQCDGVTTCAVSLSIFPFRLHW